jgi:hypothetical protein
MLELEVRSKVRDMVRGLGLRFGLEIRVKIKVYFWCAVHSMMMSHTGGLRILERQK